MTSANVTEYHVRDTTGKLVHTHHQHAMCKTHYAELLRFQPLSAYTIQSSWLDEEEENTHMGEIIGLDDFMRKWAEDKISLSQRVSARGAKTFEEVLEMQIQKEFFLKDGEEYHAMARSYIASLTQPAKNLESESPEQEDPHCCSPEVMAGRIGTKQVLVLRKFKSLRTGKYASQAAHASMAFLTRKFSGSAALVCLTEEQTHWVANSFRKIVCYVESEEELLEVHQKATQKGLTSHLIEDNGTTEFKGVKTPTAVAIGPHWDNKFEGVTSNLKLF